MKFYEIFCFLHNIMQILQRIPAKLNYPTYEINLNFKAYGGYECNETRRPRPEGVRTEPSRLRHQSLLPPHQQSLRVHDQNLQEVHSLYQDQHHHPHQLLHC